MRWRKLEAIRTMSGMSENAHLTASMHSTTWVPFTPLRLWPSKTYSPGPMPSSRASTPGYMRSNTNLTHCSNIGG